MYRYGNKGNNRKDVLYTIRDGELIFFGIACCNLRIGDKFDKTLGRKIAHDRAHKGMKLFKDGQESAPGTGIAEATDFYAYGAIHQSEIKGLLTYFHNLAEKKFKSLPR